MPLTACHRRRLGHRHLGLPGPHHAALRHIVGQSLQLPHCDIEPELGPALGPAPQRPELLEHLPSWSCSKLDRVHLDPALRCDFLLGAVPH